jgi:hypothetical protein
LLEQLQKHQEIAYTFIEILPVDSEIIVHDYMETCHGRFSVKVRLAEERRSREGCQILFRLVDV